MTTETNTTTINHAGKVPYLKECGSHLKSLRRLLVTRSDNTYIRWLAEEAYNYAWQFDSREGEYSHDGEGKETYQVYEMDDSADQLTRQLRHLSQTVTELLRPILENTNNFDDQCRIKMDFVISEIDSLYQGLLPVETQSRSSKSTRHSTVKVEKWRQARALMLSLLDKDKLPKTLRQAQKLLLANGFKHDTVRRAAHKSDRLRGHFGLSEAEEGDAVGDGALLEELSEVQGRQFGNLDRQTQQEIEDEWKCGDKQKAIDLLGVLLENPDTPSRGHYPFIENCDSVTARDD